MNMCILLPSQIPVCGICHDSAPPLSLDDMVKLACGHGFCRAEIENWTRQLGGSRCPVCRGTFSMAEAMPLQSQVGGYLVSVPGVVAYIHCVRVSCIRDLTYTAFR